MEGAKSEGGVGCSDSGKCDSFQVFTLSLA
jgi:hypothetical protein